MMRRRQVSERYGFVRVQKRRRRRRKRRRRGSGGGLVMIPRLSMQCIEDAKSG
jgi:hypothetical protein